MGETRWNLADQVRTVAHIARLSSQQKHTLKRAVERLERGPDEPPYCLECGHPVEYHGRYLDCAATVVDEAGREDACGCERIFLDPTEEPTDD